MTSLGGKAQTAYEMILEAARNGRPCPTNGEIAQKVGAFSRSSAQDAFKSLVARGLIRVERASLNQRIVTVLETGEKTAPTIAGGLFDRGGQSVESLRERRDAMLEMRAWGKSLKEIAEQFGVSKITVAQVLRGPRQKRQLLVVPLDIPRVWCAQCDRRVRPEQGAVCRSQFCTVARAAA